MNNWIPFPADVLPEPIRGYVHSAAQAISCDESYIALPILAACGSLIGNSRRLMIQPGWYVPPILWAVIVGESGTAKSPAIDAATKPIFDMQRRAFTQFQSEMQDFEQAVAKWKSDKSKPAPTLPICKRYLIDDITVESVAVRLLDSSRGLLLCREELSGWFGMIDKYNSNSKVSGDAANWLKMFGARSLIVDRKTITPGQPRTIYVPSAAVSICGGIQPGILARALSPEHRESGLAARFIFAYPPRKPKRWTGKGIDEAAEQELSALYESLHGQLQPEMDKEGHERPKLVRFSKDAMPVWIDWYNSHNAEQVNLSEDEAAAWNKLEETPARLSLILHFIKWSAGTIKDFQADKVDAETLEQAIVLTRWLANEAKRVYGMLAEAPEDAERKRLMEWVRSKGGTVSARKVQSGCRWLRGPGAAQEALDDLVDAGFGGWITEETNGRPATLFELFPTRFQGENASTCQRKSPKHREKRPSADADTVDNQPSPDDTWIDDGPPLDYMERLAADALADDSEGGDE